jgi:hypothetical protein
MYFSKIKMVKKEGFEDDFTIPLSKLKCFTRLDPDTDPDRYMVGPKLKGSRICKHRDPPHLKSNMRFFFGRNDSEGCS